MKLFSLLKNIHCRVVGNSVIEIKGLYHKDTEVKENGLFFCLRGTRVDGIEFVSSAIKNGAVAIVVEQEIQSLHKITQVVVKDAREAMSLIACRFYGNPASKLKILGVTGTNGKTTITNMLSSVLNCAGLKTALIGTNGVVLNNMVIDSGMTTPDPIELQSYLALMVRQKVDYVCMEVSAHAIDLKKVCGIHFEGVIFTNLTEDHLDYFKTMQNYYVAKSRLFSKRYTDLAIVNLDDEYGDRLSKSINIDLKTYAINNNDADFVAKNTARNSNVQTFSVDDREYKINLAGKFNVSNALSAIALLKTIGIDECVIEKGLKNLERVEGRFNAVGIGEKLVVVDYAHTPDGLKNVLIACKEIANENNAKVLLVFGCGGNRDAQKRPIMGEIASTLAAFSIVTTDNPRFESREEIALDIEKGMLNENHIIELDRALAIKKAIDMASVGDVVLIAGKGAETYIDENGTKMPFSDFDEVEKYRRQCGIL